MNPSITPKISKAEAVRNLLDAASMMIDVRTAPVNADPVIVNSWMNGGSADCKRPLSIVAKAAPNDAPALTPMMCGSASGFLKALCICAPARASAAPASRAVRTRGVLRCSSTCTPTVPPHARSAAASRTRSKSPISHKYVCLRLIFAKLERIFLNLSDMKRIISVILLSLSIACVSFAQTSIEKPKLSIPSKIAPAYFAPNAFPVPEMSDGTTSARWKAELYSDHFFGTLGERRDDYTTDIYARITIPLFTSRVNLAVYGPIYEFFHSGSSVNEYRRVPYQGDIDYHTPGDIYVSTEMQVLLQKKHGLDAALRAVLKTATGDRYEYARYEDSPGYFFDATFSRSFMISDEAAFRIALSSGFLCWQTGNGRQNDAVMYGALASFAVRNVSLEAQYGGYVGWEQDGDAPMSLRLDAAWAIGDFSLKAGWQAGLNDWPFHQIRFGLEYRFL